MYSQHALQCMQQHRICNLCLTQVVLLRKVGQYKNPDVNNAF